jgi:hypothetical protein
MLISGPRNTGSMGDEQGTTLNAIMKGMGGDHITSSGIFESGSNVGIGTSTPTTGTKLDVVGTIGNFQIGTSGAEIFLTRNENNDILATGGTSSGITIGAQNYVRFSVGTSYTERMRITSAGNVGIGMTPYANSISKVLDMTGGAGMFGYADANYLTGNAYFDGGWKAKNAGIGSNVTLGDSIIFNVSTSGTAGGAITMTERMRITNSGSVGIGTDTPATVLDVRKATANGDTQFNFINSTSSPASNTSATSTIYLGFYDSGTGLANANKIVSGKEGDYQAPVSANSFLAFYTSNTNICTEKIRIPSLGTIQITGDSGNIYSKAATANSAVYWDIRNSSNTRRAYVGFGGTSSPIYSIWNVENGNIQFATNNTFRASFSSAGDLLINTSDVDAGIGGNVGSNQYSFPISTEGPRISTTGTWYINFNSVGGAGIQRMVFRYAGSSAGSIGISAGAVSYNTSFSDVNKKKNFESWNESVLDNIKNINPQKFNFIDQEDGTKKTKGFIAQEMADKFPEAYIKPNDEFYEFNPSGMVVYLMKAIQELKAENDTLKEILQRNNIQ